MTHTTQTQLNADAEGERLTGIVSSDAMAAHRAGRHACAQGDYLEALELFASASALAPEWPEPLYDAGFACIMRGDIEGAERAYAKADVLFPRGYFATKARIDAVRREREGRIPAGTSARLVELDWVRRHEDRRAHLFDLLADAPELPQAWLELAKVEHRSAARFRAIQRGLDAGPDPETRGQLIVEYALAQHEQGRVEDAVVTLRELLAEPELTVSTEEQARLLLGCWGTPDAVVPPALATLI